MIVRCPDCGAKYEIASDQVPRADFKLRCPRCKAVFPVSTAAEGPSSAEGKQVVEAPAPAASADAPVSASRPRPRVTDPALARRMARAMISEMVLNRRAERDRALDSGTVLSRFGPAIVAAHEAYRERVAAGLVPAPRIFRDAVNEILGDGTPLL